MVLFEISTNKFDGSCHLEDLIEAGEGEDVVVSDWSKIEAEQDDDCIYLPESTPYDWLCPRIIVLIHNRGSGTVAVGLWAGKHALIIPHMGN